MRFSVIFGAVACVAAMGMGCAKKDGGAAGAGSAAASGSAALSADKIGLKNPANDPGLVKAATQFLADCGKTADEKTSDGKSKTITSCDKYAAFRDMKFEKVGATCVNLLDDPDVKVREIGLVCLSNWGWDSLGDKALAQRIVDGLAKEKAPSPIDMEWGYQVTSLRESAGMADSIKALALKPTTSNDVKMIIAAWWYGDAAYDVVKSFAGSSDKTLIDAAVQGYARHWEKHNDEACAYWAAHMGDEDKETSRYAIGHITGGWGGNTVHDTESDWYVTGGGGGPSESDKKRCSPQQLDASVDLVEKLLQAGKLDDSFYVYSMAFLVKDKQSSPALKKKATKALKDMIADKACAERSFALTKLVDADPSQKGYALGFAKDPSLKYTVESIAKAKTSR